MSQLTMRDLKFMEYQEVCRKPGTFAEVIRAFSDYESYVRDHPSERATVCRLETGTVHLV